MARINTSTIRAVQLDRGNFKITKERMNVKNEIEFKDSGESFSLQQSMFDQNKIKAGEEFYLITIAGKPCYAYASEEFKLSEDLKKYISKGEN